MNLVRIILLTVALAFTSVAWSATVNINTATPEQLTALKGVGFKKAQDIVSYREKNGKFKTIEGLAKVKGIGLKTVEKNRELIDVSN